MSRRGRLVFLGACLLAFALVAVWVIWSAPSGTTPATVTLTPGATRLNVTDLNDVEQLQARFNAGTGVPRLVLVLSPT